MWVKRPGLPPWLFHYLKTFWTWLFTMGVKQTAWIRISPYIPHILLFKWAIQRSKKWLVCSDRNHFWNIICSFWMPKISFPALLPILSGEEEGNVRNRSHFFSPLSVSEKANRSSSLEASGGHFASASFPFLPFLPLLIPVLKLIRSAWFFLFPQNAKGIWLIASRLEVIVIFIPSPYQVRL